MSYFLLVIAVFSGLLVGGGMVAMLYERRRLQQQVEQLQQDMVRERSDLLKRIEQLEQAGKKRLPYQTAEDLEHGMTTLLVLKNEFDFRMNLLDNAIAHFQKARGGKI